MSSGTTPRAVPVARTLKLAVIGPNKDRVKDLEGDWVKAATTAALANVDDSVANLSSIVVLAEVKGQRMLLTGDARGEDILSGLRGAGLLDTSGRIHVDLLKLPHHGSDRNVDTDFFRSVTADSYVISGDGTDSNPELATLGMLTEARGRDAYTINFTNRETRIEEWFARNTRDTDRFSVRYRDDDKPSIMVHLAEPLQPGPS